MNVPEIRAEFRDEGIAIGPSIDNPFTGESIFFTLCWFRDMDGFKVFVECMNTFIKENEVKIPECYTKAFGGEYGDTN